MLHQVSVNTRICLITFIFFGIALIRSVNSADDAESRIIFPVDDTKFPGSRCETHSGSTGVCRKLEECVDNREPITPNDFCSFDKSDAVYCCPVDHVAETDVRFGADQATKVVAKPLRPIEQICEHYYPSKSIQDEKTKPLGQESLPMPAELYSYEYMATFGWKKTKNKTNWKCVGVVIAENTILTDVQCIHSNRALPDVAAILHKGIRKIFNITAIYDHPDYKKNEIYHNIAVVKVVPTFSFSELIKPACVWPTSDLPKARIYRIGYTGSEMKQIFQKNVTIVGNKECAKNFKNSLELSNGVTSEVFCSAGNDKCQKETGGPLQMHITNGENGRPYVTGIASTGNYCSGSIPVLYTRITSYLDWIEPFLNKRFKL